MAAMASSSSFIEGDTPDRAALDRSSNFPYRLAVAIGAIALIGSFIVIALIESSG